MDVDWLIGEIASNWTVVKQAPMPFIAAAILGSLFGAIAVARLKREQLASAHEHLNFKDSLIADYRDKLNGADPKEAALQIQELQDHVTALRTQLAEQRELLASRWQSLSEQQRADFVDVLKELEIPERSTSPSLMLNPDFTHQDSVELAHTLSHLCAQARWGAPVYGDNLVMQQRGRPSGITVCANQERPDVKVFLRALRKVGLPYQSEREAINESIVVKIGRRIGDS